MPKDFDRLIESRADASPLEVFRALLVGACAGAALWALAAYVVSLII